MVILAAALLSAQLNYPPPTQLETLRYAQIGAALVAGHARSRGDKQAECHAAEDLQYFQTHDPNITAGDIDWAAGLIQRACK